MSPERELWNKIKDMDLEDTVQVRVAILKHLLQIAASAAQNGVTETYPEYTGYKLKLYYG